MWRNWENMAHFLKNGNRLKNVVHFENCGTNEKVWRIWKNAARLEKCSTNVKMWRIWKNVAHLKK